MGLILFTSPLALADDCDNVQGEKICWESGTELTLSWTYPESTIGDYQIEVRDFNWLGSAFLRVTHNKTVKEGMVSEGEALVFDFANGSGFDVIKIVPIQVSNINPMPANIGTYPSNPNIKMTVKLQDFEDEKKPILKVDITTEGEEKIGSRITVFVKLENSGDADLAGTDLKIYYDGLKLIRDNDMFAFSEGTLAVPEIEWENVSKYKLTPMVRTIVKDGFFIDVLNFSNNAILLSASYNQSTRTDTLYEGRSVTFNFTNGQEYRGIRILGIDLSGDGAELVLQFPAKNMLKRSYNAIFEGTSLTSKLSFLIPASSRKSFTITANASGKDHKGNG
ncbi:MAG TPA: hypothetical protein VN316_00905, partial [candidate division Zixibacteria bacterium]|nr:hypothetical protein [candidate division Zixibacteria bacterium]